MIDYSTIEEWYQWFLECDGKVWIEEDDTMWANDNDVYYRQTYRVGRVWSAKLRPFVVERK
jgi:hypothetical protein